MLALSIIGNASAWEVTSTFVGINSTPPILTYSLITLLPVTLTTLFAIVPFNASTISGIFSFSMVTWIFPLISLTTKKIIYLESLNFSTHPIILLSFSGTNSLI